ncbi:hypothetical protein ACYULU_05335 [Breznakiellaceae bacterium SP9]
MIEILIELDKMIALLVPLLIMVIFLLVLLFPNLLLNFFAKKVYKMYSKIVYKARKKDLADKYKKRINENKKAAKEELSALKKNYKSNTMMTPLVITSPSGETIKQIPSISQLDQILVTNHFLPIHFPTSEELEKYEAYKCNCFIEIYPYEFVSHQNILKIVGRESGCHSASGGWLVEEVDEDTYEKTLQEIEQGEYGHAPTSLDPNSMITKKAKKEGIRNYDTNKIDVKYTVETYQNIWISDTFVFGCYKFSLLKKFLSIVSVAKKLLKTNKEIN